MFFGFLDLAVSVAELFWISQCGWIPLLLCYLVYVHFDFLLPKIGSWGAKQKLYEKNPKIANSVTELRWAPGPIPMWSPSIGGMIMVYDFGHLHLKGDSTVSLPWRPSVNDLIELFLRLTRGAHKKSQCEIGTFDRFCLLPAIYLKTEVFAQVVGGIWPIVNHVELSKNL